jgi:hypothetical protein
MSELTEGRVRDIERRRDLIDKLVNEWSRHSACCESSVNMTFRRPLVSHRWEPSNLKVNGLATMALIAEQHNRRQQGVKNA